MLRPDHLEPLALHAAIWGAPEVTRQAVEDGALDPGLFADPRSRSTAEALVALVLAGLVHDPDVVSNYLILAGTPTEDAREAVLLAGTFEAAFFRTDGLRYYLEVLREERRRQELTDELVRIANALDSPGGPDRVAARLGVKV